MAYTDRIKRIKEIEKIRKGRKLISLCNFDRAHDPKFPISGLATSFHAEFKACLYRILKENPKTNGFDIFLYTRGGDVNSVWPIVNLLREFDENFEVLIPFRAHSAGTLFSLGAKKIVMTKLAELSPIDPSTGNQFNPIDETNGKNRLGISVEDVNAYKNFITQSYGMDDKPTTLDEKLIFQKHLKTLIKVIHPLAIGNVHRVHQLIKNLAKKILTFHAKEGEDLEKIIHRLTVEPYTHLHMISRKEATDILGKEKIEHASEELEELLDSLLRQYEDDFALRKPFFLLNQFKEPRSNNKGTKKQANIISDNSRPFRIVGGVLESSKWGYLYVTEGLVTQHSKLPNNVNIQLPPGQPLPIIPGTPKEYDIEIFDQGWQHNKKPKGVTT